MGMKGQEKDLKRWGLRRAVRERGNKDPRAATEYRGDGLEEQKHRDEVFLELKEKGQLWVQKKRKRSEEMQIAALETDSDTGFFKQERKYPCIKVKRAKTEMKRRSQSKLILKMSRNLSGKVELGDKKMAGKSLLCVYWEHPC